jgi:hypothetical protein
MFQTPDGEAIIEQDAFFWQAMEAVSRTLNEMLSQERWKASKRGKG